MPSYASGTLRRKLPDKEIIRLYLEELLDSDTIGARAGCSATKVLDIVRAAGGTVRKSGGPRRESSLSLPADEIVRRYRAGESGPMLAAAAACTPSSIYHILRRHGVEVRPSATQGGRRRKPPRQGAGS